MAKSPLALVKERFESKEKLVAAVQKLATKDLWIDRVNEDKGLGKVSNAKLLRLLSSLEDAKARFGTRAKLIAAIQKHEKSEKDDGYKARLEGYPLPRLIDLHDAAEKRAARQAKAPKKETKAKKVVRSKKAKAKAKAK